MPYYIRLTHFFVIIAIYGRGFLTSTRRAFHLIISNPIRLLVIDKVCDFLIFIGKLCITAGIGILVFFFLLIELHKQKNMYRNYITILYHYY